jgi:clan AA aspartic protease (TIGR02281 family)
LGLLGDLVAIDPYDGEFLLLESELRQQQGSLLEAIEPLLVLLQQTDEPDKVGRAREQLRLLVDVHEIQLSNRRDYAGLVRFFEHLVARDPSWDGHRLKLARWLLLQGRVADAERVAQELGSVGVTDEAREDLLAEIGLARDGLPLERSDRGLYVSATIDGRPARLLVDTGASTTVVSRQLALALGSRALDAGRDVGVRTAGGVVRGELHRIRNLRIGGLELPALDVLVLEHLPADSDGLLGMDVLGRLPSGLLPATLLGRPPGSG